MHEIGFDHLHPPEHIREEMARTVWSADNVELTTVGVDVGSSTSHLMFARVHLQRLSEALSSRFVVVERTVLWRSPILLTPYISGNRIDADALKVFVEGAYREAGLAPDDIDSGAVILTGEALKRENARAIADLFAEETGKFVCASAGHNLEALMAAHGSGAVALSREEHKTFLNVDIGGGTTKLALVHGGRMLHTAAVAVGGRLIAFGDDGGLVRIEEPGRLIAAAAGVALELGKVLDDTEIERLVAAMVDVLVQAVMRQEPAGLYGGLILTPPLAGAPKIDALTFSGGVSEYVFKRETHDHRDLGGRLADGITKALAEKRMPYPVFDPGQGIRATVIGASQFSVQVSGNTILISDPAALPLRNVPVVRLEMELDGDIDGQAVAAAIAAALARFDIDAAEKTVALAFAWRGEPLHARLLGLGRGIVAGLASAIAAGRPIVLMMDGDLGRTLGVLLARELDVTVGIVSIDGVQLKDFDFVDIGDIIEPTHVVPLVIKSLLFSAEAA